MHAELCIDAEELDMLKELVHFLKEFETFTELVGTGGPTLSLVALMELKIRKMCKVNSKDESWMKEVKSKIAANVSRRLTSNEAAKIQRVLDPDTKALVSRDTAVSLLQEAVKKCSDRGIITLPTNQGINFVYIKGGYYYAALSDWLTAFRLLTLTTINLNQRWCKPP